MITYHLDKHEVKILENYYCDKDGSKRIYLKWLDNFLSGYGLSRETNDQSYSDTHRFNFMVKEDTFLAYMLKKDESFSILRLEYFMRFNPVLNTIDKANNTLLHLASQKRCHTWFVNWLQKSQHCDYDTVNNEGHSYHTLFAKNFDNTNFLAPPFKQNDIFVDLLVSNDALLNTIRIYSSNPPELSEGIKKEFIQNIQTALEAFTMYENIVNDGQHGIVAGSFKSILSEFKSYVNYISLLEMEKTDEKTTHPKRKI